MSGPWKQGIALEGRWHVKSTAVDSQIGFQCSLLYCAHDHVGVLYVGECVRTHVWVQVCAPHMWISGHSVVSQSLDAFHPAFAIRPDIALEFYHTGQALWLTHFQGSPWLSSQELGL